MAMDLGIEGRVAVVTGASRGIGAATAEMLEADGARVVRVSRSDGIDVKAPDAAERIADRAGAPVDILVNNAGTSSVRALEDVTDEEWYEQWELHVMASMRLMRAFAPGMAARGWGRIVNVSSSAGKRPSSNLSAAYSVAKAAQLSLSRVFADAYGARGVLVNAVAPGAVGSSLWMGEGGLGDQTAAARGISREEALQAQADKVPVGRFVVAVCNVGAPEGSTAPVPVDAGVIGVRYLIVDLP